MPPASERTAAGVPRLSVATVETATVTRRFDPALAVRGAKTVHDVSSFVLVRVRGSDGSEGYGEISGTRNWSGEDDVTATHFVKDVLAPAIAGMPVAPVDLVAARMDAVLAGNPFTKAGVEMALWDLLGRVLDLPVCVLLGGPYRDRVPVKISLSGDGDELAAGYAAAVAAGFRAFKVKVGRGVAGDVARFALARELAGPDAFLGVDANGGWSRTDLPRAIAGLASHRPAFVEQPVAAGDLDGLKAARGSGVPVVADESVYGEADLVRLVRADAADAVSVYVGKGGGVRRAVSMARICAAFGLDVVIGSNAEIGVGAAAQAHVAAACERLGAIPSDIIGHHFYTEGVLEEPLDIDGSTAAVPTGPGLGVLPAAEIRKELR